MIPDNGVVVANKCNNKCMSCKMGHDNPGIDETKEKLVEIRKYSNELNLYGGEPTLRKDFFDILDFVKRLKFSDVILHSNGRIFFYNDFCNKILNYGVDIFAIHFLSFNESEHDKETNVDGSFRQAVMGIKNLKALGKKVILSIIINENNHKDLHKFIGLAHLMAIDEIFLDVSYLLSHDIEVFGDIANLVECSKKYNIRIKNLDDLRLLGVIKNKVFIGPEMVGMEITNKCNLNCVYCWVHSALMKSGKPSCQEMKLASFKRLVDEFSDIGVQSMLISGDGEPLTHPNITDMLDYTYNKGMNVCFLTNLLFQSKDIMNRLARDNVCFLHINLPASNAKTFQALRPNHGKSEFETITSNIAEICRLKRHLRLKQLSIRLLYIITELNYNEIGDMFRLADRLGVDYLELRMMKLHTKEARSMLISNSSLEELRGIIEEARLKKYKTKSNIENICKIIDDPVFKAHGNDMLHSSGNMAENVNCYNGWYYAHITPDGSVLPCCSNDRLVAGNINKNDFKSIWTSAEFHKIRMQGKYSFGDKKCIWNKCSFCNHKELNEMVHCRLIAHRNTPDRLAN